MSYDLMVFDPGAAPPSKEAFLAWYHELTEWKDERDYDDPAGCSESLRAWYFEMLREYPALNGPHAGGMQIPDDPKRTDYCLAGAAIYACFRWSQARPARVRVIELAKKHRVGFFDVGNEPTTIWRPGTDPTFDVFYSFHATGASIEADEPIPMQRDDVVPELLGHMVSEGDYIGLCDATGATLQFMYRAGEARFWLEIPSPAEKGSHGALLSREDLVKRLETLPATLSREAFPELRFEPWG